jgi:hypothetical protein
VSATRMAAPRGLLCEGCCSWGVQTEQHGAEQRFTLGRSTLHAYSAGWC